MAAAQPQKRRKIPSASFRRRILFSLPENRQEFLRHENRILRDARNTLTESLEYAQKQIKQASGRFHIREPTALQYTPRELSWTITGTAPEYQIIEFREQILTAGNPLQTQHRLMKEIALRSLYTTDRLPSARWVNGKDRLVAETGQK